MSMGNYFGRNFHQSLVLSAKEKNPLPASIWETTQKNVESASRDSVIADRVAGRAKRGTPISA